MRGHVAISVMYLLTNPMVSVITPAKAKLTGYFSRLGGRVRTVQSSGGTEPNVAKLCEAVVSIKSCEYKNG